MATLATLEPTTEETQYQAMVQQFLEEMGRLREQMQHSRREMEQSRNTSGTLLAEINALFSENKGQG